MNGRFVKDIRIGERAAAASWAVWRDVDGELYIDGDYTVVTEASDPDLPVVLLHRGEDGFTIKSHCVYEPTRFRLADVKLPVKSWEKLSGTPKPPYWPKWLPRRNLT